MGPDHSAEGNGQVLSQQVAELAGELTEAQEEPRRKRVARQISELASRRGHAAGTGAASRAGAAWRGTQAGASSAWRFLQSGAGEARRRAQSGAVPRAQTTGGAARRGAQSGGTAAWHGLRAAGEWLTAQVIDMAPRVPIRS